MSTIPTNEFDSSYRYEALFNHASMGIVVVNSQSLIQSVNPYALRLFGYAIEEILNKPIEILIPMRYHQKHVNHRDKYIESPKNRSMGAGIDLFAIKKDGSEFPVEVSLGNFEINNEKNVIAFISDISVRKKAEREILKLNDDLEATVEQRTRALVDAMHQLEQSKEELAKLLSKEKELSELKSRFVSMASHEFRTPLSTVLSSAYLAEKYTSEADQPKREKHLQRIINSVNLLTDILNEFLSVGKIEEGKIQVRLSEFDLQKQIESIVQEMQAHTKEGQKISYTHQGNTSITLDLNLLKHIALNLLSNAIKFSEEHKVIEISTIVSDDAIQFTVKDAGIGISKDDQKHLMERFFRGKNATNIQGTGLGLHIVSKYAEILNGKVSCTSELEKGTEFIITFIKN